MQPGPAADVQPGLAAGYPPFWRLHPILCSSAMSNRRPSSPSLMADSSTQEPRRSPRGHSRGDVPPAADAADDSRAGATAGRAGNVATAGGRAGNVVAAAARNPPAGARNRGTKYHKDEIEALLDLMEDNLPIGPQEWDDVTEAHADRFLLKNRDSQSLRRKFNELVNSKKPTGDPNCPPHIRRAKMIQRQIITKSDSGGGSLNDDDLGIGDDNEQDIIDPRIDPRNLLTALENTSTTSETNGNATSEANGNATSATNGNATATLRSMVTPRRRHESGSSGGSFMDLMVANMMERQQFELREREERRLEREQEREERREERKAEQEGRKAEQEERRLERAQQHQQMMMMMMAFRGGRMNNRDGSRGVEQGELD